MTKEILFKVYTTLEEMQDLFENLADKYEFQEWMLENTNIQYDSFAKMYFNLSRLKEEAEDAYKRMK